MDTQEFEIKARTCTLLADSETPKGDGSAVPLFEDNIYFQVPVYQRPYSWQGEQVRRLLKDLLTSFHGENGKTPRERMFIGTMQLSSKKSDDQTHQKYHEVIDGQQRLSTLLLILSALKNRHPDHTLFQSLTLEKVLKTRVSKQVQQQYFDAAHNAANTSESGDSEQTQNPYLRVIPEINALLDNDVERQNSGETQGTLEEFITYLAHGVYFVVIETRASLSKTIQIFDAINTAGMELNGGDVFKVRYFDYLKMEKQCGDEVFEEISDLYESIDEKNKATGHHVGSIGSVLGILQRILIARHALPKSLYEMGATTFFDRFFDTCLAVNNWSGFNREKCKTAEVEIKELKELIEVYFDWECELSDWGAEAQCLMNFIWLSRYWRYFNILRLFRYRYGEGREQNQRFAIAFSKLLSIYSILYKRSVTECKNIITGLIQRMFQSGDSAEEVIQYLEDTIVSKRENLQYKLTVEMIAHNARTKNLVCRYSAMLDEFDEGDVDKAALTEKLFRTKIDIEHIQSVNHEDEKERGKVWHEWGEELHRIGNLMVLEQDINRSISNGDYAATKLPAYRESQYAIARNQAKQYECWSLDASKKRKEAEVQRLVNYLCSPARLGSKKLSEVTNVP